MKPLHIFAACGLVLLLILVGRHIYLLQGRKNEITREYDTLRQKFESVHADNDRLKADIEFYSHPENLEKELRERFNYHRADEKMMIIVPQLQNTSSQN